METRCLTPRVVVFGLRRYSFVTSTENVTNTRLAAKDRFTRLSNTQWDRNPPNRGLATVASFGGCGKDRHQPVEKALFLLRNANFLDKCNCPKSERNRSCLSIHVVIL